MIKKRKDIKARVQYKSRPRKSNRLLTMPPRNRILLEQRERIIRAFEDYPHMDSNIPANPAYGVYISQLVRYVRIYTSKLDFIRRLRRLSSRLLHQWFKSMLLHKSFTKFFKRHSAIIEKYGTTLREIRLAIQN